MTIDEPNAVKRELPLALRSAYMALHRKTNAVMAEHNVSADQFVLLLALQEGQAMTQRELANRISSDPSTVRAMLELLEKMQLIKRGQHPNDARARTATLSAKGRSKLKVLWKAGQEIRDAAHDCMSPQEAALMASLLQRMVTAINVEEVK